MTPALCPKSAITQFLLSGLGYAYNEVVTRFKLSIYHYVWVIYEDRKGQGSQHQSLHHPSQAGA